MSINKHKKLIVVCFSVKASELVRIPQQVCFVEHKVLVFSFI